MKRTALALAAALTAAPALAVTVYEFALDGSQTHFFDPQECLPTGACAEASRTDPWTALLVISLPDGDGSFADGSFAEIDGRKLFPYPTIPGGPHPLVITVSGGAISLDGRAIDATARYAFDGSSVSYLAPSRAGYGQTTGSAVMAAVSHAPEPSSVALLLAGLAAVGFRARRARP